MANHKGSEGTVKIGANTVAEIREFSFDETGEQIDDSELSDTWDTHQADTNSWSGELSCFWDETDTNGQEALTVNASVALNLYPEGAESGDVFYAGTATVTSISRRVARNAMVEATFQFKGNGALTRSTVA